MAQDTAPAIVVYQGTGSDSTFSIPFDKGYYGKIKVLFVRRGLANYTYYPSEDLYEISGRLYAWYDGAGYVYTHTPTPAVGASIYNVFDEDTGDTVSAIAGQTITVNDVVYTRSVQHDVANNLLLTWNGDMLEVGDFIAIVRETEGGQPYVMPNNQKHIERALDNLERQIQELQTANDSTLKIDPSYDIEDSHKMNPIDWLKSIIRCMNFSVRALRYQNGWLDYSLDDPNIAESDKTWTHLLATTNIKNIRESSRIVDGETIYFTEYQNQNGTWKTLCDSEGWASKIDTALATSQEAKGIALQANTTASQASTTAGQANTTATNAYNKAVETEQKVDSKQDILVAGDNIQIAEDGKTISATSTTYSAGNGLTLTGTTFSANVVDNATSDSTINALSARVGKVLQEQINNLNARGKFLSVWNCTTGLAMDTPPVDPYTYESGAFFIVGVVASAGGTNYKPSGSTYSSSTPSTVVETEPVKPDDTYYYDGTNWRLVPTQGGGTVSFASLLGSPTDNTNLSNALDAKQATLVSGTNIKTVNGTSVLGSGNVAVQPTITGGATTITSSNLTANRALVSDASGKVAVSEVTSTELGYLDGVTSSIQTQLNDKQATISDLTTIRSGAELGATAAQPTDVTSAISTHDSSESAHSDIRETVATKSTVSVSATGTATDEVQYITIDGTEKKLAGGGAEIDDTSTALDKVWSASKANTMIGDIESLLANI